MKPLLDEPALVHGKTLVLADLHLGIEVQLAKGGVNLPSQIKKYQGRISNLLERTKASKLVLLGDVKHNVPQISWREQKGLPRLFRALAGTEIHIVKGNHDGLISTLVPKEVVVHEREMVLGKYLLTHGNKWIREPGKCKTLVMAHNHPCIEFQDPLGFRSLEPVWIRAKLDAEALAERVGPNQLKDCIIMPAFNELVGGIAFNKEMRLLGPYLKGIVKLEEAEAYLLDGAHLGKIKDVNCP